MRISSILVASLLVWASCESNGVDTQAPRLEILSLSPTPTAFEICGAVEDTVFLLTGGDVLELLVAFDDDQALSQYKIDIHNNFDCHGHGGGSAPGGVVPAVDNFTEDLTVLDIGSVSGLRDTLERSLLIPENVTAGNYHFQIQVLDESGNDVPLANFYSLSIKNPMDSVAPEIEVNTPVGDFTAVKGEKVRFTGTVTDNYSLSEGGNGVVFITYTDLSSGNTFTTNVAEAFNQGTELSFEFDLEVTVPNTLVAGEYLFTVRAHDGVRNVATPVEFMVQVTN